MNYDLVIATTTCFSQYGHVKDAEYRRKLFQRYSDSLSKTDWAGRNVFVALSNDAGIGWNQNYRLVLQEVRTIAPLCLIADSDAYFDPGWLYWLLRATQRYPDACGWTLYNSPRMKDYDDPHLPGKEFIRRHVSPHGLCFRTEDYIAPPEGEWFEAFIGELHKKHPMGFIVPTVSLIQHAGLYGLNNVPGASEDFDPHFPYNEQCGINIVDGILKQEHNPREDFEAQSNGSCLTIKGE